MGYIARRKSSPPEHIFGGPTNVAPGGTPDSAPAAELTWGVLWDERLGEGRTVSHPGKDDSNAIALARFGDGRILYNEFVRVIMADDVFNV